MTQIWNEISAQEEFVLELLENKKGGHYVELGAFHSKNGSNTNKRTLEKSLMKIDPIPAWEMP